MKNKLYTVPNNWPSPSTDAISHANSLCDVIIKTIEEQQGKISFAQFMQLALYAPGLGYYSAGSEKIGASGDFVTAPEISPLFSYSIAKQCQQILAHLGEGDILEFGAGSGKMAVDILTYLSDKNILPKNYFILETSAELKQRQLTTFEQNAAHLLPHVQWLNTLPTHFKGIMLANEVLDAMPVNRFLITDNDIQEYYVGWHNEEFTWLTDKPTSSNLTHEIIKIKQECLSDPVEHYTSEINLHAPAWLHSVGDSLTQGALLLIDYGFPRNIYYHPQRAEGTLMCHYRHRAHANPLILVGLQDITAHVDFSSIAKAAAKAKFAVAGYTTQADFLLNCGILDLVGQQSNLKQQLAMSQQIQTLIMPHEMGELFKVMLLTKNLTGEFIGFP